MWRGQGSGTVEHGLLAHWLPGHPEHEPPVHQICQGCSWPTSQEHVWTRRLRGSRVVVCMGSLLTWKSSAGARTEFI